MKDFYPRGTGDSRYLKSSIPATTSHDDLISMLRSGTFPIDLNGINNSGVAQQGTPLNKATLLKDATAALFGFGTDAVPDDVLALLSKAALYKETPTAQIGTLNVGTTIYIDENSIPVPYIIVNHGKPQNSSLYDSSCNGTWVLRKDIYKIGEWRADASNNPIGADIYSSMEEMLNLYGPNVKSSIKTVKIPYCVGGRSSTVNSGANGLQCKIFPLGGYEVGWTTSTPNATTIPVDGAILSYFEGTQATDAKRIAKYNGSNEAWWLRSSTTNSANDVKAVGPNGQPYGNTASGSFGIRPCFILPDSFIANTDKNPSGLYSALGDFFLKVPGVQIATGSYVGTGKYGSSNPNSLTFEFEPKFWWIYAESEGLYEDDLTQDSFYWPWGKNQNMASIKITYTGNTVSWYSPNSSSNQYNDSGRYYYYLAIC